MAPWWIVSLRQGVTLEKSAGDDVVLLGPYTRVTIRSPAPSAAAALLRLAPPGDSVGGLMNTVLSAAGPAAAARFCDWLRQLTHRGYLRISVCTEGQPLASLEPLTSSFVWPTEGLAPNRPHILSRFAYMHCVSNEVVLESPLSQSRVVLHDGRAAAVVYGLAAHAEADGRVAGLSAEAVSHLTGLLYGAGMLNELIATGVTAEDELSSLRTWDFHDLLFHTRSREGRHAAPFGATYPFVGQLPPPPVLKPSTAGEAVELERADLDRLKREDPPFAEIVEQRCSIREYAAEPLTVMQLGEFLYRVARVRNCYPMEIDTPVGPVPMEFTSRPYPAGGALYELELYPVVQACDGLTPGLYHYDPLHHRLERISGPTPETGHLLANAGRSSGTDPEGLQVLLIVAARFQRVAWKYAAMAYALTLKNVGVLYQTMYLTATAMDLAPCALGAGDSDLFARATGTDYYTETSVGEFLLGSRSKSGDRATMTMKPSSDIDSA